MHRNTTLALFLCGLCATAQVAQAQPAGGSVQAESKPDAAAASGEGRGQEEREQFAGSVPDETSGAEAGPTASSQTAGPVEAADAPPAAADAAGDGGTQKGSPPSAQPATTTAAKADEAKPARQPAQHARGDAPASAEPPKVRIVSLSEQSMLLYRRVDESWQQVCAPPCEISAPKDPQDYGLSSTVPGAGVRNAGTLWVAPGDGIEVRLRDRRWVRRGGGALAAAALAGFLVDLLTGFGKPGISFPIIGGAFAGGVVMTVLPDRGSVRRCIGCNASR